MTAGETRHKTGAMGPTGTHGHPVSSAAPRGHHCLNSREIPSRAVAFMSRSSQQSRNGAGNFHNDVRGMGEWGMWTPSPVPRWEGSHGNSQNYWYFRSVLNSQAYPIGRSLTLAREWFPGTYSYCLYQVRFVTIDGDDGGSGNSNGDSDDIVLFQWYLYIFKFLENHGDKYNNYSIGGLRTSWKIS